MLTTWQPLWTITHKSRVHRILLFEYRSSSRSKVYSKSFTKILRIQNEMAPSAYCYATHYLKQIRVRVVYWIRERHSWDNASRFTLKLDRSTELAKSCRCRDAPGTSKGNFHFDDQIKQVVFLFFSSQNFPNEIEDMFSVFLLSYSNSRESLQELVKAVETLACHLVFPQKFSYYAAVKLKPEKSQAWTGLESMTSTIPVQC